MSIRDSNNDWRILVLNQEMPVDKEADAGKEQKPARDKMVPKKLRIGQNSVQQNKGGVSKKIIQVGKKNNTHASRKQEK
jgi:hypothetical protein